MASESPGIDYVKLETYLRALAYASRLELLNVLRAPRALSEIRLQAQQSKPGEDPQRTISRQAVQDHLERLIDAGVVIQGRAQAEDSRRVVNEYVVNQQRLYAILEELRRVFTIPGYALDFADDTAPLAQARSPAKTVGPCLVLVHGLHEGKTYALRDDARDNERGWVLGRRADAAVGLPYDPFVSTENAEIHKTSSGFELVDLAGSRNGTLHNWARLPPGGRVRLAAGDVIGVGRSLLVFREA